MQVCTLHQHLTSQFLQAGCPSCRPTNSVNSLEAIFVFFCCFIMTKIKTAISFRRLSAQRRRVEKSCTQGCRSVLFPVPTVLAAFPRGRRVYGRRTSMGDCRLNVSRQRSALSAALRSSDAVQPFDVWIVYLASTNSSICERGREADTEEGRQKYRGKLTYGRTSLQTARQAYTQTQIPAVFARILLD